jgi:hypothetical protein
MPKMLEESVSVEICVVRQRLFVVDVTYGANRLEKREACIEQDSFDSL